MAWSVANLPSRFNYQTGGISASTMLAYADQQVSAAQSYIIELTEGLDDLTPPEITPEWPDIPGAPVPVTTTPPEMQDVIWNMPGLPSEFSGTLDVDDYLPEPFDESPPDLVFGSPPAEVSATLPSAPGISLVYDDPVLDITLPSAPDLMTLNVQSFGGVTIPDVDFSIPELTVVAPDIQQYTPGDLYTSGLLAALQEALQDQITNGGTGLNPDVEQALWDRARQREYQQTNDSVAELDRMETLGYSLPPGIWLDARLKLTTNLNYNSDHLSREIMIAQAKLEQDMVAKAWTTATQLEGQLIDYNNAVEQRLFDAARYATEAGIALYNAKVSAYGAYVDAYKAKVQIYEARIRAELAKVDAYKAEISAEEAKARINVALVDQYKAQVDAALSGIEVFKAEIMAIQSKAEIEKLKVQIFGEEVRAYSAQVNAYTAGVEGFKATVQAEATKQDAFTAQVRAYSATVDANVKVIEAQIREYEAQLRAKEIEWEGYKAAASAESSRAQATASYNDSLATAYRAEVSAISAYNDAMTKQWQVAVDQAQRTTEIAISAAKANAELYITTRSLALDASKVGAQVSAQLGASALGALSLSDSFSMSNSAGFNTSYSYSAQQVSSESVSASV